MQIKELFVKTIKEHEGVIYKIAKIYASTVEDQKDLYQEIVFQLWKSFESFKGKSKISTWMYRVALNTSIAYVNREKRIATTAAIDFQIESLTEDHDPIFEHQLELLYKRINHLNIIEKGLILLFLEGKTYEEMATITGFTTTNVGTRLGRIKQKLKNDNTK